MASTKRTRRVTSKGLETVILKDLKCLQKLGNNFHSYTFNRSHDYLKHISVDHLLCHETLEDLEDVWATPRKPHHVKKARSKDTTKLTSPQTSPVSPVSYCHVPPNSPAVAGPVDQGSYSPYIAYLIQSWDRIPPSIITRAPAIATNGSVREMCSSVGASHQEDEANLVMVNPDDILVIPDSTREELSTNNFNSQSPGKQEEQCVPVKNDVEHNHPESAGLTEASLFIEDGIFSIGSYQQPACQLDQVVPEFELEE